MNPKNCKRKTLIQIAHEWDEMARIRDHQIESGIDISYKYVLIPNIVKLFPGSYFDSILDVGCGTGTFTNNLLSKSNKVIGIDISFESIRIAIEKSLNPDKLHFIQTSIENYSKTTQEKFSLIVSNMSIMSIVSLPKTIKAIFKLTEKNGYFIFTIVHPFFWPYHLGFLKQDWFEYNKEIWIESPFLITLDRKTNINTTYVHRSLEYYINTLTENGFTVERIIEPVPNKRIVEKYGTPQDYPRFLVIRCKKNA